MSLGKTASKSVHLPLCSIHAIDCCAQRNTAGFKVEGDELRRCGEGDERIAEGRFCEPRHEGMGYSEPDGFDAECRFSFRGAPDETYGSRYVANGYSYPTGLTPAGVPRA